MTRKTLYRVTLECEHITSTNVVSLKPYSDSDSPYRFTEWGLVPGTILAQGQDPSDFVYERARALLEAREDHMFVRFHSEYHVNVPLKGKAYYLVQDINSWTAGRHLKEGQI